MVMCGSSRNVHEKNRIFKQLLKPAGAVRCLHHTQKQGEHFPNSRRLRVGMLVLITDGMGFAVGGVRRPKQ